MSKSMIQEVMRNNNSYILDQWVGHINVVEDSAKKSAIDCEKVIALCKELKKEILRIYELNQQSINLAWVKEDKNENN